VTFILLFVVPLPYATICHARRGTLGERVFQIQLRDATDAGAPVRVGQAFGRAVMTYVFGVLFFGGFSTACGRSGTCAGKRGTTRSRARSS